MNDANQKPAPAGQADAGDTKRNDSWNQSTPPRGVNQDDFGRAQSYLDAIPVAPEGGRNDTLNGAAFSLLEHFHLSKNDHESLLLSWAARCSPPMNDTEARKTIASAWAGCQRKGAMGTKRSVRHTFNGATSEHSARPVPTQPAPRGVAGQAKIYDLAKAIELPEPMENATREFLLAAFEPGESVAVAREVLSEEKGKGIPEHSDINLTREQWIEKLDANGGDVNKFLTSGGMGAFCRINPISGNRDSDVTAYRHALLEFDKIGVSDQWALITQSQVPCSVVLHSGNKSLHAWVRVDAKDRDEYNTRVTALYDHFSGYIERDSTGKELDRVRANKNPSRFSRLPGMVRTGGQHGRQELLAVNVGAKNFLAWRRANDISQPDIAASARPIGELELPKPDGKTELLKNRFLCRGGGLLIVGPTGVGKSSLSMQMAIQFALGKPIFDITPASCLRSLIVQAENDDGDMAEMFQGVCRGVSLSPQDKDLAGRSIITIQVDSKRGAGFFIDALGPLLERFKPDLAWIDPALAYIDGDSNSQEDVGEFLRTGLNPLLRAHNCSVMVVHHTAKPRLALNGKPMPSNESYRQSGSAEFSNWARAIINLVSTSASGVFELTLGKRGNRLGWKSADGITPSYSKLIAHSKEPGVICWNECDATVLEASNADGAHSIASVLEHVPTTEPIEKKALKQKCVNAGMSHRESDGLIAEAINDGRLHEWAIKRPGVRPQIGLGRYPQPVESKSK